jgi:outer membrane murein-binding lipoprotein Lpp
MKKATVTILLFALTLSAAMLSGCTADKAEAPENESATAAPAEAQPESEDGEGRPAKYSPD